MREVGYRAGNVVILCPNCHVAEHEHGEPNQPQCYVDGVARAAREWVAPRVELRQTKLRRGVCHLSVALFA